MSASGQFLESLHEFSGMFMRNSMRNFLHFAKERGISMPQIGALFRIRKAPCTVSDISAELRITNAAASQMLEGLVQQELIRRSEDPDDRRAKQLVLTEKGRKILQDGIQARQGWMHHLVDQLTPQEQQQITAALKLLVEKTSQLEKKKGIDADCPDHRERTTHKEHKES
jgi:DNA-binding MarR family transcriptional regulator